MNLLIEALFLLVLLQYLQISGLGWLILVTVYVAWKLAGVIVVALVSAIIGKVKGGLK